MAQAGQNRPRIKAKTADIGSRPRSAGVDWTGRFANPATKLWRLVAEWIAAEVAPGRLAPWIAIAFGAGIVVYFTAEREPAVWAAAAIAIGAIAASIALRRHAVGFPAAIGVAAIATGFAVATIQSARIAHPVLRTTVASAAVEGFVEIREERERSDRVVIRVQKIDMPRGVEAPDRIRVAVRKGTAPSVGSYVVFKAHLSPPLPPLRPGGYDFARDMFFQRIGASGYALGAIKTAPPLAPPGLWLRYATVIDTIRETIDKRIRAAIPGDEGSIASALITGKRDAISTPVNDAMYISSLAHVLSISGYHMAVVAGIVFFFIRAALALVPALASRYPIKKWAASAALAAAAFYLLLSGNEVATQRSFIMIAIVLIGVIADRSLLTFRTLTVAAIVVLIFAPEAVVHPSFQMSFAATLALIAGYQHGLPWRANLDTPLGARIALWGGREIAGLLIASLVAGLATTPYAAFHFHRLAPYGVLANLAAMPVVSAVVMPAGIVGVLAMPFGFDDLCWRIMGAGIDWMIVVVLWVANLPGAVGRIQAFGTGPLLLGTLAILLVCLLRTPLRWSGALLAVIASLWAVATPRPDVLIANDGLSAAIRGRDGRLAVLTAGRDTFAIKEWLAADADERDPKDKHLRDGVRCDAIGCIGQLADGRLVSMALSAEAFAEDCSQAAVVVSPRLAPGPCRAVLIDRDIWRDFGAIALRWNGTRYERSEARPAGHERPWTAERHRAQRLRPVDEPLDAMPGDLAPPVETQ
jgi:competence protein ComEC